MENTETEPLRDLDLPAQPLLPRVRLVYSAAQGVVSNCCYTLPIGATPIGRDLPPGEGILLAADKRMSRVHATLHVLADGAMQLVDGGSKNGSFVNGQRLSPQTARSLVDEDIIRTGDSYLIARREPLKPRDAEVSTLIGQSLALCTLRSEVRRLAPESVTVLLLGETGTGKEVVAQALHNYSGRRGDFVAVNCAAIPESLAESQLFGHVAGAFTGAKPHPGLFRAADGGTLFLDEVGELPLPLQAKLLRAVQERAVTPVGGIKAIPCDVRLLAATHRDLLRAVEAGQFREDLYGRLAGILLELPPLRQRREDILLLLSRALADSHHGIASELVEQLLLYRWPRNVREILQVAEHIRLLGIDDGLRRRLTSAVAESPPIPERDPRAEESEADVGFSGPIPDRAALIELLKTHRGIVLRVAQELACSRRQLGRILDHYRIDLKQFRTRRS